MKTKLKYLFTSFPFCIATYCALAMMIALFVLGMKTRNDPFPWEKDAAQKVGK